MTEPGHVGPHYCAACGETHGGEIRPDPDVEIARIMADRDIRVAQLERGEARHAVDTEAETTVAVAEADAIASIGVAAAMGPPVAEPAAEPEPEPAPAPVVVEPVAGGHEEVPAPAEHEHEPPKAKPGYWSGYAAS